MRIKKGFVVREIAGNVIAVPTGDLLDEFKGIINLNCTARFIWELLQKDTTIEEVAQKLVEKYHFDEERASNSAHAFIKQLQAANIIEE